MNVVEIVGIAFGLAMDAFAVGAGTGLRLDRLTARRVFRLSFHFGFFQFAMPILGWLLGRSVADHVSAVDHWIAAGLLFFVAGKMVRDSVRKKEEEEARADPTRGMSLVILSVATSIDAFAVGLGLAFIDVSIWLPCVVIGVVASAMTVLGMFLGRRLGRSLGKGTGFLGAAFLIAIGVKILVEHLS